MSDKAPPAKKNPHGLVVGQEIWFVPTDKRFGKTSFQIITKIGSKWGETDARERFDLETLYMDSGAYSPRGRYHLSKEVWEADTTRKAAWDNLTTAMRTNTKVPDTVALADINQALELLGLAPEPLPD